MRSRRSGLIAGIAVAVGFAAMHSSAGAGSHCRRPAADRGIAILPPLESPDPCDAPVGGRYRYTPYYPGYAPDRRCLVLYGQTSWPEGIPQPQYPANRLADYGAFTGARRDEANLLRLGGNSPSARRTAPPQPGSFDVIDRMHSYQP